MADLNYIVDKIRSQPDDLMYMMREPMAQFGSDRMGTQYLGARFLPERMVDENRIEEDEIKFRPIIANYAGRNDPAQKRDKTEAKGFEATLGDFNIKREINGNQYEKLVKIFMPLSNDVAERRFLGMLSDMIQMGLKDLQEKERWQAMTNLLATVRVVKTNGEEYDVVYENPVGHRFNSPFLFTDDTEDPFEVYFEAARILKQAGYSRILANVTSQEVGWAMCNNEQIRTRTGGYRIDTANNAFSPVLGMPTDSQVSAILGEKGIPAPTYYDEIYHTELGTEYFFPRDAIVLIAQTPRREEISRANGEDLLIRNTLGYYAVGRCQGEATPGNIAYVKSYTSEIPKRLEAEGAGTGLAALLDSNAIVVIRNCINI